LFNELTKLNKRIIYFDTDSIIFTCKNENEYKPKLVNELGMSKDELNGKWIIEIVSGGCKNYSYLMNDGSTKCIIKGFALNSFVNSMLNFETMKDIVLFDRSKKIIINQLLFKRDKFKFNVSTQFLKKNFAFVYDKRILDEDFTTSPFGYKKE